jgi:hypothetical protein
MPNRNDKMYRVNSDGTMEIVLFIESGPACEGCTDSWLMRRPGAGRFRTCPNAYEPTAEAAWKRRLQELERYLPDVEENAEIAAENLTTMKLQIVDVKKKLGLPTTPPVPKQKERETGDLWKFMVADQSVAIGGSYYTPVYLRRHLMPSAVHVNELGPTPLLFVRNDYEGEIPQLLEKHLNS